MELFSKQKNPVFLMIHKKYFSRYFKRVVNQTQSMQCIIPPGSKLNFKTKNDHNIKDIKKDTFNYMK